MKNLGLIVNPIAGVGGRVGLKGSDGEDVLKKAWALGAEPESPNRAIEALRIIADIKDDVQIITYPHEMGEDEARECGFDPIVLGSIESGHTSPADTQKAAREMAETPVDLLLFAGGDGTARNIFDAVGTVISTLGIPAGVKIHSAVYAVTPRAAGEVTKLYLQGTVMNIREAEVMDIDEEAFRKGIVTAKLYGYLLVPEERRYLQSAKSGRVQTEKMAVQGMAAEVVNNMVNDFFYIIGPGTTTRGIMDRLGLRNTLLGVDVIWNKELIANDVTESQLMSLISGNQAKVVVTVIGGQGHLFGRGNQQISPRVLWQVGRENIIVIASKEKLLALEGRPLLVDSGDEKLNQQLSGYIQVITGFMEIVMYKVGYE